MRLGTQKCIDMFRPTYMPNLVTLAWKISSGMSKEASSLSGPLCAYKWGRTSMIELVRNLSVINVLPKFENDPWKIMDVRVLTGLVCPAARQLRRRQYPRALKGCVVKSSVNPVLSQIFGHQRAENEARITKMYRVQEIHPIKVNARYEMNWANSFFKKFRKPHSRPNIWPPKYLATQNYQVYLWKRKIVNA